jgi:7-carboxy-7-deazaguanine synthase
VPLEVIKIVDIKCPGSGEAEHNDWRNLGWISRHDQVKFVIKNRDDYEFARDVSRRYDLAPRCAAVLMSPVHGELDARTLSEWMLADRLPARLQLQIHKFIWHPSTRGV